MSDWWSHFAGAAALAGLTLWVGDSLVLAFVWPTMLGYARETEQFRADAEFLHVRPSNINYWSDHRVGEFVAWPLGAACVCVPAFLF